jgi:iron complex outermembrane receptor protein
VTGGAVIMNTKRPNLQEAEGSFKGALENGLRGTGNNYYAMGAVSVPLIENQLAFKLSGYYNNDRGWHKRYLGGPNLVGRVNTIGGAAAALQNGIAVPALGNPAGVPFPIAVNAPDAFVDFGKAETWIVRPMLLWAPTDAVSLLLKYEHFDSSGDGPASQNHPGRVQPPFNAGLGITPPTVPSTNVFFSAPKDSFLFSINEPGNYTSEADSATAELNIDIGPGTLTNIFGWRDTFGTALSDIDATPMWLFHSDSINDQDQISNELRYAVSTEKFDVTIGGYYFSSDHFYQENRRLLGGFRNFFGGGEQHSRNYGVFGQFDFHISDTFTIVAGARYTDEKKEATLYNLTFNNGNNCNIFTAQNCVVVPVGNALYGRAYLDDTRSWSNFTPKVGFQWDVRDWMNLYGHYTQGVRSGGYNFRNTSTAFLMEPFDEEEVTAYEVGFKAQPGDGKVQVNAAFFINDIKDMQREINLADPLAGVVQLIRNTADATIFGIELESQIFLTDNLVFQGNLGHLDGDYDSVAFDLNSDGVTNATDLTLQIPRLAKWTYGAGFIHSMSLGGSELTSRINYSHRDDNAYTDNNLGILQGADLIDASLAVDIGEATLSLYGQNLLNEVTHGGETQLPGSLGGGSFAPLNKGRVVGLEVLIDF